MAAWESIAIDEAVAREAAYLVARGVRALALIDPLGVLPEDGALRIRTLLERAGCDGAIPFVIETGAGEAVAGYASYGWVIDLYAWAHEEASPRRDQVLGLLFGYSPAAIARFLDTCAGGVRWSPERDSTSRRAGIRHTAGTSRPD